MDINASTFLSKQFIPITIKSMISSIMMCMCVLQVEQIIETLSHTMMLKIILLIVMEIICSDKNALALWGCHILKDRCPGPVRRILLRT